MWKRHIQNIDIKWCQIIGLRGRPLCLHRALLSSFHPTVFPRGRPGRGSGPHILSACSRLQQLLRGSCRQDRLLTWRPAEDAVPGGAVEGFSEPTLDSSHTELACMWSLGRLHGSSISIRLEGERGRRKIPSNSRASNPSLVPKDPRTRAHTGQP